MFKKLIIIACLGLAGISSSNLQALNLDPFTGVRRQERANLQNLTIVGTLGTLTALYNGFKINSITQTIKKDRNYDAASPAQKKLIEKEIKEKTNANKTYCFLGSITSAAMLVIALPYRAGKRAKAEYLANLREPLITALKAVANPETTPDQNYLQQEFSPVPDTPTLPLTGYYGTGGKPHELIVQEINALVSIIDRLCTLSEQERQIQPNEDQQAQQNRLDRLSQLLIKANSATLTLQPLKAELQNAFGLTELTQTNASKGKYQIAQELIDGITTANHKDSECRRLYEEIKPQLEGNVL